LAPRAYRLLAWLPSAGFVATAVVFSIFLTEQTGLGNKDGMRWFAFSAFPLAVVFGIAIFTRLQKKLDQQYGRNDADDSSVGPLQS